MPDNDSDAVLPIPSDLYLELGDVQDQLEELQRKLVDLEHRYHQLSRSSRSLDVDNLGEPISPLYAAQSTEGWLASADSNLWRASEQLARARGYASRLKLTDHACEQQLAQRRPPAERTR